MSNILEWYEKQSDRLRLIFVIISGVALATSLTFSWTGNADKIAGFDPAWLVVISLTTAIVAGTIIGNAHNDFWLGFTRAVTVLVVFCPCAFVLATPTAISARIGNASKHGLLIQSGEALERIASSNIAVFDKTGTLTKEKPAVVKVQPLSDISEDELIKIAASGEALSNHPLAKAIMDYNKSGLYEIKNHKTLAGSGIEFEIDGKKYMVGKVQRDFKDA